MLALSASDLFGAALTSNRTPTRGALVRLDVGVVEAERGYVGSLAVDAFLGVPFAQPPVGSLRFEVNALSNDRYHVDFQRPEPVQRWRGVRPAKQPAKFCSPFIINTRQADDYDEDCLYLNVYRRRQTKVEIFI